MIKFIYFDVGGVAMLDFSGTNKWELLKKGMGVTDENNSAWENVWTKYKNDICISRDVDTLVPFFREIGFELPENYSILDDFINLFEQNRSLWPIVAGAIKKYRVGLLTNMYPRMLPKLFERKLLLPAETWDIIIDSSNVGLQKPDRKIFQLAQQRAGVNAEEILFVENTLEHIQAAQEIGWQTFAYDPQFPKKSSSELMNMLHKNRI